MDDDVQSLCPFKALFVRHRWYLWVGVARRKLEWILKRADRSSNSNKCIGLYFIDKSMFEKIINNIGKVFYLAPWFFCHLTYDIMQKNTHWKALRLFIAKIVKCVFAKPFTKLYEKYLMEWSFKEFHVVPFAHTKPF